jgi:hypothetical protein
MRYTLSADQPFVEVRLFLTPNELHKVIGIGQPRITVTITDDESLTCGDAEASAKLAELADHAAFAIHVLLGDIYAPGGDLDDEIPF